MLNINGIELEFDMSDADVYERYMKAAPGMDAIAGKELTEEEVEKDPSILASLLREKCAAVKKFMDEVFGNGTGEKICGKGNSWNRHMDVLMAVIDDVNRQARETKEKRIAFEKKYESRNREKETGEKKSE